MNDWTVTGVDKKSGRERVLAVNALTEDEARAEAAAAGLVVDQIRQREAVSETMAYPRRLPPAPTRTNFSSLAVAIAIVGAAAFFAGYRRWPLAGTGDPETWVLWAVRGGLVLFLVGFFWLVVERLRKA